MTADPHDPKAGLISLPVHCSDCGQRVTLAYTEDTTIRTHQWVCPNCAGKNTIEVAGRDFAVHTSTRTDH